MRHTIVRIARKSRWLDMHAESRSNTCRTPTARGRRVVVLACLLAFLATFFGHMEPAAAAADHADIAAHHSYGHSDDSSATSEPEHCMQHGQCSVHGLLPTAPAIDAHGSNAVGIADDLLCRSRAVEPLRRPPKALETT